jgi:hypothetical protein
LQIKLNYGKIKAGRGMNRLFDKIKYVGKSNISEYDVFKDTANGNQSGVRQKQGGVG